VNAVMPVKMPTAIQVMSLRKPLVLIMSFPPEMKFSNNPERVRFYDGSSRPSLDDSIKLKIDLKAGLEDL
jgi:hypothetical protein